MRFKKKKNDISIYSTQYAICEINIRNPWYYRPKNFTFKIVFASKQCVLLI